MGGSCDMENLYCKIFVYSLMTREQLSNEISDLLDLKLEGNSSIETEFFNIDFFKNKEFDKEKAKEFPDGFLFYPYFLSIDIIDKNKKQDYKEMIKKIMLHLWSKECKLVVSCDFEDELPHEGGYKSLINHD